MLRGPGCAVGLLRGSGVTGRHAPGSIAWVRPSAAFQYHQSRLCFGTHHPPRHFIVNPCRPSCTGNLGAKPPQDENTLSIEGPRALTRNAASNLPSAVLLRTPARRFGTSMRLGSSSSGDRNKSTSSRTNRSGNEKSTGEGSAVPGQATPVVEEEGKIGKLRLMIKRYGAVAVVTYLGVYVGTLGILFATVESGVNPFDYGLDSGWLVEKATGILEGYSWSEPFVGAIQNNPHAGNFAVAWILTKFTEPVRMLVTITIVPRIARALGKAPAR